MKIKVSCVECSDKYLGQIVQQLLYSDDKLPEPSEDFPNGHPTHFAQITNDFVFCSICPLGHENTTILQNHKFEVLFHLGMVALKEGYYREAVFNFATAVERFYEFFIEVVLHRCDITNEAFRSSWKYVAAQSERQLGGYYFISLLHYKEPPLIIEDKLVKLRNKVIHTGNFPSKQEAEEYGHYIYDYIHKLIVKLQTDCLDSINKVNKQRTLQLTKGIVNTNTTLKSVIFCVNVRKHYTDISEVKSFWKVLSDFDIDREYIDK